MFHYDHNILMVEDNPEDYKTMMRALTRSGIHHPVYRCEDGDEALEFLFKKGQYESEQRVPRPDIILLDLNLPGTDGREVLDEIKNDSDLKKIPVIVLTSSSDLHDIDICYKSGANSYIQKPVGLHRLVQAIESLTEYWFDVVILPNDEL